MSIFLRINSSGPATILIPDMGIILDKSITDNEFSEQDELNLITGSIDLLALLIDDAYGANESTILMSYDDNGAKFETAAVSRILENILLGQNQTRASLEEVYNYAYSNHYTEFTYTGDDLTSIDVWEDSGKILKLFSRILTYTGDNLTKVTTTDEINSTTLVKDLAYSGDNLVNIVKTLT
jgi:hypothetical protein